jgi:hypothetical protein
MNGSNVEQLDAAAIAAAIRTLDVPALQQLAGLLAAELAAERGEAADDAEVERRLAKLAAAAREGRFGKLTCPLCGNSSRHEASLRRHLRRYHRDEIAAMPAGQFKPRVV